MIEQLLISVAVSRGLAACDPSAAVCEPPAVVQPAPADLSKGPIPAFVFLPGLRHHGAAAPDPAEIVFTADANSTSNASEYTFSSIAVGTASADRVVAVGAAGSSTGTDRALTAGTIGGNAAGVHATVVDDHVAAVMSAGLTTGTTATIVATFSSGMQRAYIGVYALTKLQSSTPVDTDTVDNGTTGSSFTMDMQAGSVALGVAHYANATTRRCGSCAHRAFASAVAGHSIQTSLGANPAITWTGLDEDDQTDIEAVGASDTATSVAIAQWR